MRSVCYLDMDGVLTDFARGALAIHQATLPFREIGWGFPAQIGFSGVDDPRFWEPLGFDFWAGLEWTHEGKLLLSHIENLFGDDVVLMTSPCDTPGSVEGKVAWIRRELPRYARRFFVGPPKHLAAGPGKLLVDDYEGNVEKFAQHGGSTVLVPRPWNYRIIETDEAGNFSVKAVVREIQAWLLGTGR